MEESREGMKRHLEGGRWVSEGTRSRGKAPWRDVCVARQLNSVPLSRRMHRKTKAMLPVQGWPFKWTCHTENDSSCCVCCLGRAFFLLILLAACGLCSRNYTCSILTLCRALSKVPTCRCHLFTSGWKQSPRCPEEWSMRERDPAEIRFEWDVMVT